MSDDEIAAIIDDLDPTPAAEALPVSRRQALRALAGVGALGVAPGGVAGQAGTVRADEAYFSNYDIEQTAAGVDLTIDGQTFAFDGSDTIGLPDGGQGTALVTPSGATASAVVGPSGEVVWERPPLFEQTTMSHARTNHTTAVVDGQPYVFGGQDANSDGRATAEFYDGSGWVSLPDMSHARYNHTTAVVDGQPYVFGGRAANADPLATAEYAGE